MIILIISSFILTGINCNAVYSNRDSNSSEFAMIEGPAERWIPIGSPLELTCTLMLRYELAPNTSLYVFWFREEMMINFVSGYEYDDSKMDKERSGIIRKNSVEKSDEGNYTCLHSTVARASVMVHVEEPINIVIGKNIDLDDVRKGDDVYFYCLYDTNKLDYRVDWIFQGEILKQNLQEGIIFANQSLVLQKVSEKSIGNYSCRISHNGTIRRSAPIHLDVKFIKMVIGNGIDLNNVHENSTVYFNCLINDDKHRFKFDWIFQGEILKQNIQEGIILSNQTLVLQNVSKKSIGNYRCRYYNGIRNITSNRIHLDVKYDRSKEELTKKDLDSDKLPDKNDDKKKAFVYIKNFLITISDMSKEALKLIKNLN